MRKPLLVLVLSATLAVLALTIPAASAALTTELVSLSSKEKQGIDSHSPAISANGRFVAFWSFSTFDGSSNGLPDVFIRDRRLGTTRVVSVSSNEVEANGESRDLVPAISADGRFVAFASDASNLVAHDAEGFRDVFVRDRMLGTTKLVSKASNGAQANQASCVSCALSISANGRFIVFPSFADNLVPNDTNGASDIFVRDRKLKTTTRVDVSSSEEESSVGALSVGASISADGRFVAFTSGADNLVAHATSGNGDVFIRDRQLGKTKLVSVKSNEEAANDRSWAPSVSANGRFVAFASDATDLVSNDGNGVGDIFIRDRLNGTTRRISVSSSGSEGDRESRFPTISGDGMFVAFDSQATNLVGNTPSGGVFLRDRLNGKTGLVTVNTNGHPANGGGGNAISQDGRFIAFESFADDLVPSDTNMTVDVFVRGPYG